MLKIYEFNLTWFQIWEVIICFCLPTDPNLDGELVREMEENGAGVRGVDTCLAIYKF